MKKLLPLLLMFACPAWGATALEIYHTAGSSEVKVTADTWTTHNAALTVNRSGEAGTKEFIIIAQIAAGHDNASTQSQFRVIQNISGTHSAGTSTTVLTDSGAAFATATGGLVGYTLYNTTDGSRCIVTSNTGTTATCAHGLEGGTEDDWDTSDGYQFAVGSPGKRQGNLPTFLGTVDEGQNEAAAPGGNNAGLPANSIMRRVTLDNSSHTFTWQGRNKNATGDLNMEQSSIVVLERSANMEYTDTYSAENFDSDIRISSGTRTDLLALSFTATAEVWVAVFNVERNSEDEGDAQCNGVSFVRETTHPTIDTTFMLENACLFLSSTNDHAHYATGGLGFETLTAATHRFAIEWDGGNAAGDETEATRASILAFPVSDFENSYTDTQASSSHGTTYSDTNVDLDTQAVTSGKVHLTLAGYAVTASSSTTRGGARLSVDGDTLEHHNPDDRGTTAYWPGLMVYAKTIAGSTATFKVEGQASSGTAVHGPIHMVVLEIPDGAAPAARRRMSITMGGM